MRRRQLIMNVGACGLVSAAAGWATLADRRMVPGRSVLDRVLGRCDLPGPAAEAPAGPVVDGAFRSDRRGREVRYALAYPPGAEPGARLPVCLVLHGYAADERAAIDGIGYHRLLAAAVHAGAAPFVLATVAGGDGYWHPHPGDDPHGMLLHEFPAVLAGHGLRSGQADRLAILGWSMGGYGALLASSVAPGRFAAVVANAPAFWRSYAEARRVNPGAFDTPEQWQEYGNLVARADTLRGPGLWIEVGESDPFAPAVEALRDRLADPTVVRLGPGCHDTAFWRHAAPAQLRFIADALAVRN